MSAPARGFSLLEMLAAIGLLALALSSLLLLAGRAARLQQRAAQQAQLALDARSLLDAAGVVTPLQPGRQQGWLDDGRYWQLQVRDISAPPPAGLRLLQLDLDLSQHPAQRAPRQHFRTLRLVRRGDPAVGS